MSCTLSPRSHVACGSLSHTLSLTQRVIYCALNAQLVPLYTQLYYTQGIARKLLQARREAEPLPPVHADAMKIVHAIMIEALELAKPTLPAFARHNNMTGSKRQKKIVPSALPSLYREKGVRYARARPLPPFGKPPSWYQRVDERGMTEAEKAARLPELEVVGPRTGEPTAQELRLQSKGVDAALSGEVGRGPEDEDEGVDDNEIDGLCGSEEQEEASEESSEGQVTTHPHMLSCQPSHPTYSSHRTHTHYTPTRHIHPLAPLTFQVHPGGGGDPGEQAAPWRCVFIDILFAEEAPRRCRGAGAQRLPGRMGRASAKRR